MPACSIPGVNDERVWSLTLTRARRCKLASTAGAGPVATVMCDSPKWLTAGAAPGVDVPFAVDRSSTRWPSRTNRRACSSVPTSCHPMTSR